MKSQTQILKESIEYSEIRFVFFIMSHFVFLLISICHFPRYDEICNLNEKNIYIFETFNG